MTIKQFLNYIQFSRCRPDRISAARWSAMMAWYRQEMEYEDSCELWAEQHVLCS